MRAVRVLVPLTALNGQSFTRLVLVILKMKTRFLRTAHLSGYVNSVSVSLNRKALGNQPRLIIKQF